MKFACALAFVVVLPAAAARIQVDQSEASRDKSVVEAIIRNTVVRVAAEMAGLGTSSKDLQPTVLSAETLVGCKGGRDRCIGQGVIEVLRACAASGKVPYALASLLERTSVPRFLPPVDVPKLSMVRLLVDLKGQAALPMAISAPVYLSDQSLVYVQFGHGFNGRAWLTLLRFSADKGWVVESEFLVSVGNSPVDHAPGSPISDH